MAKNKLNPSWLNRHLNDHYVHMAQKDGYRSRAAYKLLELVTEFELLKQVNVVVDLGCAPGSWSQVIVNMLRKTRNFLLVGLDILGMEAIEGLNFIQGDFMEETTLGRLVDALEGKQVDLIISDIAPEFSGIKSVDYPKAAYLVELVFLFAGDYLKVGGDLVVKVFQGSEFDGLVKLARTMFKKVLIKKPSASRRDSSEMYLLCKSKIGDR